MQTNVNFDALDERMVYVKPIQVSELPADVQRQAEGLETLFAVHGADGQQLALVADRKLALYLAREHNYAPQPVH